MSLGKFFQATFLYSLLYKSFAQNKPAQNFNIAIMFK